MKMKKFTKKSKAFVVALAMVVMMLLLPTTTNAQTKIDGFFDASDMTDFVRSSSWEFVVINQQFGNMDTPLGTGLLIMTFAGTGYAVLKRKKED